MSAAALTCHRAAARATLWQIASTQDGAGDAGPRVRAVILQSTGPVFSSGHDFKDFTMDKGRDHHEEVLRLCTGVNIGLQELGPPVIAAVQGYATAGGLQLAASCDLIIAASDARFCLPGTRIGGFCHTPAVSVAEKVHPRKALEMLLLAEDFDAQQAQAIGLANKVVAPEELSGTVLALASKVSIVQRRYIAKNAIAVAA